jgi:Na+/H+-dicarboxylate symporter
MVERQNSLRVTLLLAAILLGGVSGWFFGAKMESVKWIGDLFLDALKMVIVPLVVSSMIVGVTGIGDVKKLGRVGTTTFVYFLFTTCLAVLLGLVLVNLIQPGVGVSTEGVVAPDRVRSKESVGIVDIIRSLVSPNIVKAMVDFELLPLIIFSLIFGGFLSHMGERGKSVSDFFSVVNEIVLKIVGVVMLLAPLGIFALVASRLGRAGGGALFWAELLKIGLYASTVIIGLAIHGTIILPLFLRLLGGRSPLDYVRNMLPALATAFSTASSSATLPLTIEGVERNGVSRHACLFVVSLGATVNMNGTALYEAVAALFIAQASDIHLSVAQQILVLFTATLAAIGAPGIPEAGLVTMVMVLRSVGLPLEGIGLILAIDWFLDRCRTTVNVWDDAVAAAVIDRLESRGTAPVLTEVPAYGP